MGQLKDSPLSITIVVYFHKHLNLKITTTHPLAILVRPSASVLLLNFLLPSCIASFACAKIEFAKIEFMRHVGQGECKYEWRGRRGRNCPAKESVPTWDKYRIHVPDLLTTQ